MSNFIHECRDKQNNILNSKATYNEAVAWLEDNGGGIYMNALHRTRVAIKAKEKITKDRKS